MVHWYCQREFGVNHGDDAALSPSSADSDQLNPMPFEAAAYVEKSLAEDLRRAITPLWADISQA
jgi:hypothetical protein